MIVVDASIFMPALADDGPVGDRMRSRLHGEKLIAPELIDIDVLSAIKGRHRGGYLSRQRADLAVADLIMDQLERVPHHSLLVRCWQLRDNLSCYDAVYVALAESHRVTLVTGDARIRKAPGIRCEVEVLS